MHKLATALAASGLFLSGCATYTNGHQADVAIDANGREIDSIAVPAGLRDPVMRLRVASEEARSFRAVNTFYLEPDGRAFLVIEPNQVAIPMRWAMQDPNTLCFDWPVRGRECWPYQAMRTGESVRLTSSLGVAADVTRLSDRLTASAR